MRRLFLPVLACCLICFADAEWALSKGGPGRGGGGGGGGGRSTTQRGNGGGGRTVTRQNGGGNRPTLDTRTGGGNRPTLDTQSRGNGNRPPLDTQSRGNGNRPPLDTQSRGNGNRPTLDTQSRGNGNRPPLDTQSRGNGNRPTLDTQSRGNRPTIDREARGNVTTQTDPTDTTQRLTGRDNSLNVRQLNEERKWEHRNQIADQLEANADRNGNENLRDTAQRMRDRADEQYTRNMTRITGETPDGLPGDMTDVGDGFTDDLTNVDDGFTNDVADGVTDGLTDVVDGDADGDLLQSASDELFDSNAFDSDLADAVGDGEGSLSRVLAREDRKLQHQLDVAQQLRDIAARNGNDNLIQTAERMEDMAYSRYDRQIEKFFDPVTDAEALIDPLSDVLTDPLVTEPVTGPTLATP